MTELRIDIGALVDQYREDYSDPDMDGEVGWPVLYRIEIAGKAWLTDRYWILPESVCVLPQGIDVKALPESNTERVTAWLSDLADAELAQCDRVFAPCFAGTFTLAGLTAYAVEGWTDGMAALVVGDGTRVGVLMAHRERTAHSVALPVPDKTVKLFRRIREAGSVRYWQAWDVAAYLTSGGAS